MAATSIKAFEKKYGVKFTVNHTGKMDGMQSLSTSVLENKICQARAKVPGSICEKCFSQRMSERYGDDYNEKFKKNHEVLTTIVIPVNEWPLINARIFRLEAFADLNNVIQVQNYFNFAERNKGTIFALWTKNPEFINEAIKSGLVKKPKNLVIIQSSCMINIEEPKKFDFIDKTFTVYDKKFIAENNININCGARNCLECGRCYSKRTADDVREQLK